MIPKKVESRRVADFRPISLISSLYKLISKVVCNRIREIMWETVAEEQVAFVEGRQVSDLFLIANEVVEAVSKSGEDGVVLKHDRVNWEFLDFVHAKKGFDPRWRKWISGCLSSSISVLVNGKPRENIFLL